MANYNLISKSLFNPFTFDELLKPALMATLAHLEIENLLSDLNTKASIWEGMADETNDAKTYALYKKYANDLKNQADLLASEGLNIGSRKALNEMKSRYSLEITPIELAYAARKADIKRQQDLYDKDLSIIFERDASNTSLDEYLGGKDLLYKQISGDAITKYTKDAAIALSKEMRDNPRDWKSILHGLYFLTMMQKGYRPEEIVMASINDPSAPQELKAIMNNAISNSGIMNWKGVTNEEGNLTTRGLQLLNRVLDYAKRGLWSAVGETKYETLANKGYLATPSSTSLTGSSLALVLGDTPRLGFLATPKANELYIKYKDFFDSQGNLTTKGKRVLSGNAEPSSSAQIYAPFIGEGMKELSKDFRNWITNTLKADPSNPKSIQEAYMKYSKSVVDIQGKDTQEVRITPKESEAVIRLLMPSFKSKEIPKFYSIDWESGETKNKGLINLAEITKDNPITSYLIVPVETNAEGVKIIATLKDGRMFEIPLSALGTNNKIDFIRSNIYAIDDRKKLKALEEDNKELIEKAKAIGFNNLTSEEQLKVIKVSELSKQYLNNIKLNWINNLLRMRNLSGEYESETGELVPGKTNIMIL